MKGYIQGQTIILIENLPENLHDGDEIEIFIKAVSKPSKFLPIFELGIKDEYLNRENIYEKD